jgi:hypothetical protein
MCFPVTRYPFALDQVIPSPDWERYCASIVGDVVGEQSPKQLLVVRAKLYQLLINCIPASVIMKVMWWFYGIRDVVCLCQCFVRRRFVWS